MVVVFESIFYPAGGWGAAGEGEPRYSRRWQKQMPDDQGVLDGSKIWMNIRGPMGRGKINNQN